MLELKKNKTIILTTHAMEEADILADRIAVIVDGQIKCVGSSLNLKNTYGDGYRISLHVQQGLEAKVIGLMNQIAPSNKFIDDSGGSMIFSIPISKDSEMESIFQLLDEEDTSDMKYDEYTDSYLSDEDPRIKMLKSFITDCGISHCTLEEVFMKVTGKKQKKEYKDENSD
jgi:ABC-type multidrug transport system ATPase subunit